MSIQTKKGFTLIELMVVIVIIGILAAIAIPKLFGMTAKAKASEVGPAAGTWVKLQQAYKMETGNYGTGYDIAYKLPGGNLTADDYKNEIAEDSTSNFRYNLLSKTEWQATSKFNSDPCELGSVWTTEFDDESKDDPTVEIDNEGCKTLTPNWCNMGQKGGTVCK